MFLIEKGACVVLIKDFKKLRKKSTNRFYDTIVV
jgi:hypothetical protein